MDDRICDDWAAWAATEWATVYWPAGVHVHQPLWHGARQCHQESGGQVCLVRSLQDLRSYEVLNFMLFWRFGVIRIQPNKVRHKASSLRCFPQIALRHIAIRVLTSSVGVGVCILFDSFGFVLGEAVGRGVVRGVVWCVWVRACRFWFVLGGCRAGCRWKCRLMCAWDVKSTCWHTTHSLWFQFRCHSPIASTPMEFLNHSLISVLNILQYFYNIW